MAEWSGQQDLNLRPSAPKANSVTFLVVYHHSLSSPNHCWTLLFLIRSFTTVPCLSFHGVYSVSTCSRPNHPDFQHADTQTEPQNHRSGETDGADGFVPGPRPKGLRSLRHSERGPLVVRRVSSKQRGSRRIPEADNFGPAATLTPDEARNTARTMLASARLGSDPAGERAKRRKTETVAEVAEAFLKHEAARLRPKTMINYRLFFRRHVLPRIGNIKVVDVTHADIARLHHSIGAQRPVTANRVVRMLGAFFRYAARHAHVPKGFLPTDEVKPFREHTRERYLTAAEFEQLGSALTEAETIGLPWVINKDNPSSKHVPKTGRQTIVNPFATAAIRLLIFTGCRLREILHLRWHDVDFDRGLAFLAHAKTGRRAVILNAPALAVLNELARASEYVITGNTPDEPRSDLNRPWRAITHRAGLGGVRIHDLRHSFASVGAADGLGLPIIGKLLGHKNAQTTARYAHLDNDPLRKASNRIAHQIAALLDRAGDRPTSGWS